MEYQLHRQLKQIYAGESAQQEVRLGRYRIDAIRGKSLIEIQVASLAAIRTKIAQLLKRHPVVVVKPLVVSKELVKLDAPSGSVVSHRKSPYRGGLIDLFYELIYFRHLYPHSRLTLEIPLVRTIETRYPGHGKRRRWRTNDFQLEDVMLTEIVETHVFRSMSDLTALLPATLPKVFGTRDLAEHLQIKRGYAQQITYCLREMGGIQQVGKKGNGHQYQISKTRRLKPREKKVA
jgi:hypothetical protein